MKSPSVYFAACSLTNGTDTGLVKVGHSSWPERRVSSLGALLPINHSLIGTVPGEAISECVAHLVMRPFRSRGEYFWLTDESRKIITRILDQQAIHPLIEDRGEANWCALTMDVNSGMKRLRITPAELVAAYGRNSTAIEAITKGKSLFSRPLMAAVALAAARKGRRVVIPEAFMKSKSIRAAELSERVAA